MANYPEDLRYTKEHEWTRLAGNKATVGITSFAKDQLGDVVYLELPEVGAAVTKGQPFGVGKCLVDVGWDRDHPRLEVFVRSPSQGLDQRRAIGGWIPLHKDQLDGQAETRGLL